MRIVISDQQNGNYMIAQWAEQLLIFKVNLIHLGNWNIEK
ncbi:hypothetical protein Pse7429DRAFT_1342 [Pseudanabaena biceps PCC 7429]|uniref:Uncharacterized protein n=1 Tax=Pseudanabaena biceps PCC 7429 TaxID=927668 RepID=L8N5W7_9CYAN|nr:hypothetical protein Pse7429DRAFT_1342 [Pseudanabaena biceps PCC 7429]